jgi:hypothetical protein
VLPAGQQLAASALLLTSRADCTRARAGLSATPLQAVCWWHEPLGLHTTRTCVDARMCCTFLFHATHVISGAGPAPAAAGPCRTAGR